MGAVTVAITNQFPAGGPLRLITGTLTMSNSYAAGGDTCPASAFGCSSMSLVLLEAVKAGVAFTYDHTNSKVIAYYPTGGSVTAPTSVSAVPVGESGATPVTSSAATLPITPGVGKEVGATADLSTVVLRFVAYGA